VVLSMVVHVADLEKVIWSSAVFLGYRCYESTETDHMVGAEAARGGVVVPAMVMEAGCMMVLSEAEEVRVPTDYHPSDWAPQVVVVVPID
jgi:hypothetical protein